MNIDVEDVAKGAKKGAALLAVAALVVRVDGRPVKERDRPAKIRVFGIPVFERLESGKQYVLFWRIRDVRKG